MTALRYAAMDTDGSLLGVENDLQGAVELAEARGAPGPIVAEKVDGMEPNPTPQDVMPEKAFRAAGLGTIDGDEVLRMTLEEAHHTLAPYFNSLKYHGKETKAYKTPLAMVQNILGQNYKTAKQKPGEPPSWVMGLSLVPHKLSGRDWCVGSNALCREGCLVYSGQNKADPYNQIIKFARSKALSEKPVAFGRVLVEAVAYHEASCPEREWYAVGGELVTKKEADEQRTQASVHRGKGFVPYVRLNVFSDIPWELTFPDLFGMLPDLQFYDYTKVLGRETPPNYDLTFSFSGTNRHAAKRSLEMGQRVAVVFLVPGTEKTRRTTELPTNLWGYPVVDGDVSDLRPLDRPAVCVVGLRWKTPRGQKADPQKNKFVIPCYEEGGVIVAAGARHEPIVDADQEREGDVGAQEGVQPVPRLHLPLVG
jgi:hypothetical protein